MNIMTQLFGNLIAAICWIPVARVVKVFIVARAQQFLATGEEFAKSFDDDDFEVSGGDPLLARGSPGAAETRPSASFQQSASSNARSRAPREVAQEIRSLG